MECGPPPTAASATGPGRQPSPHRYGPPSDCAGRALSRDLDATRIIDAYGDEMQRLNEIADGLLSLGCLVLLCILFVLLLIVMGFVAMALIEN